MNEPARPSGEAFATERLRDNPDLEFVELQQQAAALAIDLQPIHFGRARRKLGLTGAPQPAADHPEGDEPPADEPAVEIPAAKPAPRAFDFLVEALRAEPTLSYGELKRRSDERDLKIAPIMYGRAKALLGLVPVRPRGQGKNRRSKARIDPPAPIAAPPVSVPTTGTANADDLVELVKKLDTERRELRDLLTRIANSIDEALGYDAS